MQSVVKRDGNGQRLTWIVTMGEYPAFVRSLVTATVPTVLSRSRAAFISAAETSSNIADVFSPRKERVNWFAIESEIAVVSTT